jgi:HAMP domain-containing protein
MLWALGSGNGWSGLALLAFTAIALLAWIWLHRDSGRRTEGFGG